MCNTNKSHTQWVGDPQTGKEYHRGSPTKVKQVENVVFQAKESKRLTPADEEIDELMKELITNHTIG